MYCIINISGSHRGGVSMRVQHSLCFQSCGCSGTWTRTRKLSLLSFWFQLYGCQTILTQVEVCWFHTNRFVSVSMKFLSWVDQTKFLLKKTSLWCKETITWTNSTALCLCLLNRTDWSDWLESTGSSQGYDKWIRRPDFRNSHSFIRKKVLEKSATTPATRGPRGLEERTELPCEPEDRTPLSEQLCCFLLQNRTRCSGSSKCNCLCWTSEPSNRFTTELHYFIGADGLLWTSGEAWRVSTLMTVLFLTVTYKRFNENDRVRTMRGNIRRMRSCTQTLVSNPQSHQRVKWRKKEQ